MKIAVPSYQVRSGYMPVCWSGTSLFEILDPPLQMKQSNPELFDQLRGQIQKAQQPNKDPSSNEDPPTTKPS